ncbi:MAG: 3-phosphoserine/phosphohydroxythreonine transaminase [Rhodocyclaceae bacterium]|nr:MAG: 3-phosphoserine/phosphohydroxythreonine transaminase [Rhodocyclaceae bacterium]
MSRVWNFSAGPAMLPESVLRQAAEDMLDWHGCGMGVMEMSHRGKDYMAIHAQATADLRELLDVPDNYKVLFLQGGGIGENAIIPMNLIGRGAVADFVITGSWSKKSEKEARKYGKTNIAFSTEACGYAGVPPMAEWRLSDDPSYVYACTNETVMGVEFPFVADLATVGRGQVPMVADMSSHILSRPVDVSKYGLIYAGAQKNIGPAGVTLVIIREDLLGHALPICPTAFDYKIVADHDSMYNTPPTYSIYIAGLVFQWLKAQGGLAEIERKNIAKAELLYGCIDASGLYESRVEKSCRSRMNVPFYLKDEALNEAFLEGAKAAGLVQLKGHKTVGGMRASLYNAMPLAGVQALVDYMREFERTRG